MKSEHCHRPDSRISFTTQFYNITTTASKEWAIVVDGAPCDVDHMRHGRIIHKIDDLMKMDLTIKANLHRFEVIALVLYTGPMVSGVETGLMGNQLMGMVRLTIPGIIILGYSSLCVPDAA